MTQDELDQDAPVSCSFIAESTGASHSLVVRLARLGIIETVFDQSSESSEPAVSHRSLFKLKRMQRLRRDLGVNFSGAVVILDLVERISALQKELNQLRNSLDET